MRSFKRISNNIPKARLSIGTLGAIAMGGLFFSMTVSMMDDLLLRWEQADRASLADRSDTNRTATLAKPDTVRVLASVAKVKDTFTSAGYELDAVRRGQVAVPRLQLASLPHDISQIRRAQDRKAVFLRYMLPYVLEANSYVQQQRTRMLSLQPKVEMGQRLGEEEAMWLNALYEEYHVKPGDFATLSLRVDTVPVSLALAQAAVESGWGRSRFAQEGNAPFGQWTTKDHAGMVPKDRKEGMTHKVRSFESLYKSAESYLRNLNTHRAYKGLRELRASFRRDNAPVDSRAIAGTLLKYSEKGMAYVDLLRDIIEKNDLQALDSAELGDAVLEVRPDA